MFSLRSNLLQVGQADLLRGSFLSNAICEAHAAKQYCIRFAHAFLKAKDRCVARRHSLNTVVCEQKAKAKAKAVIRGNERLFIASLVDTR